LPAGVVGLLATLTVAACGEDDFENEPRPPVPVAITGVVTEQQVEVSPNRLGAGPIVLTISNQTPRSHRIALTGRGEDGTTIDETTGPVNPQDTATIQQSLPPGAYRVAANSDGGTDITPGRIVVDEPRPASDDALQLP
jgi:hypothetical protein